MSTSPMSDELVALLVVVAVTAAAVGYARWKIGPEIWRIMWSPKP